MDQLWAPWRMSYVTKEKSDEEKSLIFEKIAQSNDDEGNGVLLRSKSSFAVLNKFPYNAGHSLIVPYRCVGDINMLDDDELLDLLNVLKRIQSALQKTLNPQGFNIGMNLGAASGAGIEKHLHMHLVPRWKNDANFITTTADTRIHPTDLPVLWKKITEELQAASF